MDDFANRGSAWTDFALALLITLAGATIAWFLATGLPPIGIDDAAITRSYADNLARGLGYVYNAGGERVEGSTAFLWVAILTAVYKTTAAPEVPTLVLCGAMAVLAVFATLRYARFAAERLDIREDFAIACLTVFLLANPGYFFWSVWSMMELVLWSMTMLWLLYGLTMQAEARSPKRGAGLIVFVAAMALPLVRPEGIAVTLGLLALAVLLAPPIWKSVVPAMVGAVASFVAVTAFRLWYFGQPFPNTFYAKVSSDRLQDLTDGLKYLAGFVQSMPLAEVFVGLWIAAAVWALLGLGSRRAGAAALILGGASVAGMLAVYAVLGGDHFVLWRFYQPIAPILPVAAALGLAWAAGLLAAPGTRRAVLWLPTLVGLGAVTLVGWLHYYQSRFDILKEFVLVERGIEFGTYLNGLEPRPSVGTGPAGGIALAYEGPILDLLGLNWTEMAHANPVKVGMRNHASFDKGVFWSHQPEVLTIFNRPCGEDGGITLWASNDDAFDGLFSDARFRDAYQPVTFHQGDQCWPAFAEPSWLDSVSGDGIEPLEWSQLQVLN